MQREALRIGGEEGLQLARQVAMLTYRTPTGLRGRFGRRRGTRGAFSVQEWLWAHGAKLDARFDRASYLALLDAMDGARGLRADGEGLGMHGTRRRKEGGRRRRTTAADPRAARMRSRCRPRRGHGG